MKKVQVPQTSAVLVVWEQVSSPALESSSAIGVGPPPRPEEKPRGTSGWRRPPALHGQGRRRAGRAGLGPRL